MTISVATTAAAKTNALLGGNPFVLAENVLEGAASATWRGNLAASTDLEDTQYPGWLAYNGISSDFTRPTTPATATIVFCVELDSNTVIDTVFLQHNCGALYRATGVAYTVAVELSGNRAGSVDSYRVFETDANVDTDDRFIVFSLEQSEDVFRGQFANAEYLRIIFTAASGSAGKVQISNLAAGVRLQLSNGAQQDYDGGHLDHLSSDTISDGGTIYRYTYASMGHKVSGSWDLTDSSRYGLDDIATAIEWRRQCKGGARPFLWVEQPPTGAAYTSTAAGHWMFLDSPMVARQQIESHRVLELEMTESAPYRAEEH